MRSSALFGFLLLCGCTPPTRTSVSQPATAMHAFQPAPATAPVTAPATRALIPPVDAQAVAALIRQLGNDDFAVREAATRKLIGMGPGARPLVEAAVERTAGDPETAQRLQVILTALLPALTGRVVDHAGKPVGGATVTAYAKFAQPPAAPGVSTEPDGTFAVHLPPGEYAFVEADAKGIHMPLWGPFKLRTGDSLDVGTIKLPNLKR
jgi:hypothetical protein